MASNHIIINDLGGKATRNSEAKTGFFGSIVESVVKWQGRASMRRQLASLDKKYLVDMGVSSQQALDEISKPFWRA
ncbi:hypothetical protein NBZ79_05260 [Sneathiella marina]|uniref:DUF1127 domain-containing protein n=1 Tax=Sneathiella marina TaxID=2950108 RepID=A0ABY4W8Y5_9PROT|nr:hypothetical protein [Sneathiella marina]USG62387.1 hypothetical protein NBZ79_05260 [Sneathiella marina]